MTKKYKPNRITRKEQDKYDKEDQRYWDTHQSKVSDAKIRRMFREVVREGRGFDEEDDSDE